MNQILQSPQRMAFSPLRSRSCRSAVLCLYVCLLGMLASCVTGGGAEAPAESSVTPLPMREDARDVLVSGEVCTYGVSWAGFLPVGKVSYRLERIEGPEGRPMMLFEGLTEPALKIDAFLKSSGRIKTYADAETFLPVTSQWTTLTDPPYVRTTWFRHDQVAEGADQPGVAYSSMKYSNTLSFRALSGPRLMDPLGPVFYLRVADLPQDGSEVRLFVVEGSNQHLVTLRWLGEDTLLHDKEQLPCTRYALRSDALDANGELEADAKANSDLEVWVAETPERPILRIAGKLEFGKVALKLAKRTVPALEDQASAGWTNGQAP